MAAKTFNVPQPGIEHGISYIQSTITGDADDGSWTGGSPSGGVIVCPALAGHVGVIDRIDFTVSAAETVCFRGGGAGALDELLVEKMPLAANTIYTLENIRSEAVNTAIRIFTLDASSVAAFMRYHYEISG
jgi:hypothetical protein